MQKELYTLFVIEFKILHNILYPFKRLNTTLIFGYYLGHCTGKSHTHE